MNLITVTIVNDNIAVNKTLQNGLYLANPTNSFFTHRFSSELMFSHKSMSIFQFVNQFPENIAWL